MIILNDIGITALERDYPEFKYSTNEMLDRINQNLSEVTKENILNLGVKERYFLRSLESYIGNDSKSLNEPEGLEPISELCAKVAVNCLEKAGLNKNDVTCLIAASEDNDYRSPGLSSILIPKIGFSSFLPHYNIQGMACSTLPKLLELGKQLIHDENDKILFLISGCNSGWYLPHLKNTSTVMSPHEIDRNNPNRKNSARKWIATMFSFLFGDGVTAFVLSKVKPDQKAIKIGKITHAVNVEPTDYRTAYVKLVRNQTNTMFENEPIGGRNILEKTLNYSKKVLTKSMNGINSFDQNLAESYMSKQKKIMLHTGSLKIIDGFKNLYKLKDNQIQESYDTLTNYGNLTGVSVPTVMSKAMWENSSIFGQGLLVCVTMGFGLDLVEIEKV